MTDTQKRTIEKLIKLNQEMLMAEINHAKKTGIRHQPNKTYFKKLRKQKKLLSKTDEPTLRLILEILIEETDEITKPSGLKASDLDTYSKEEMIEIIVNTRYLHEFLAAAIE
ncbi:MAG: hypothetical protein ACQEQA_02405 [Bacillota bacterium]